MTKVTGYDAIQALVSLSLGGDMQITEHQTGIDVDNGARYYDHEHAGDYKHLMWDVLLYSDLRKLPEGYSVEDLYTAHVVYGKNGSTDVFVDSFTIHTEIFDNEDRGTHYDFRYQRVDVLAAEELYVGDEVAVAGVDHGVWHTVETIRERPEHEHIHFEGGYSFKFAVDQKVRVRRWVSADYV